MASLSSSKFAPKQITACYSILHHGGGGHHYRLRHKYYTKLTEREGQEKHTTKSNVLILTAAGC